MARHSTPSPTRLPGCYNPAMTINSIADIAGDNAVHPISAATEANARKLWLTAIGGTARFGAKGNVGAAVGVELPEGVLCEFSASSSDRVDTIDLTQAAAYVPSGTTLTIAYGI